MRSSRGGGSAADAAPAIASASSAAATPLRTLFGIAIESPAAVRPDVDAAELLGGAGDLQDKPPLVLVVVDPQPADATVGRAEEAALPADRPHQVERRRLGARRRLAEAEGVDLLDLRNFDPTAEMRIQIGRA